MKKIFSLLCILFLILIHCQNTEFSINDDGLTKYVVTSIPGISKEASYKKTMDWINKKFNTPEKNIKGTIENEYIRIEAVSYSAMRFGGIGGAMTKPVKFQIEVSFKDHKYKFEVAELQEENYMFPQFSNSPFMNLDLSKKSEGVRKPNGQFRGRYRFADDLVVYFNFLNSKLKDYITNTNQTDDNW
ncbi:hypothetical protein [Chryseobacterium indologenes]|uniref:hypothetical protein n=1 Tax=Chryseobacterium indologenes TaxID=253 RepID=UPI0030164203